MANSPRWRRRLGDAQLAEIDGAVRQASARGLGWQTITAEDLPLPSCADLAEDIRAELEDGSGIVLLHGISVICSRVPAFLRKNVHLVAVSQIYWRLEYQLIAVLDAGVDLDLGTVIGRDRDFVQMGDAVFGDRHLHAVLIEDDR
jgi:hypothetical protein